eukprot:SAG22_NODE_534_length_9397_cov_22.325231_2_plen_184_part_00
MTRLGLIEKVPYHPSDDTFDLNELLGLFEDLELYDAKLTPKVLAKLFTDITRQGQIVAQKHKNNNDSEMILDEFIELVFRCATRHTDTTPRRRRGRGGGGGGGIVCVCVCTVGGEGSSIASSSRGRSTNLKLLSVCLSDRSCVGAAGRPGQNRAAADREAQELDEGARADQALYQRGTVPRLQ